MDTLFARGGGYLVYLSDVDVPFFRVSSAPIFSRTGYQKKAIFWIQLSKYVKRGNVVRPGCYLVQYLCFGGHFFFFIHQKELTTNFTYYSTYLITLQHHRNDTKGSERQ